MPCNGCSQYSGNGSSVGSVAGEPRNPYTVNPAATGPVSGPISTATTTLGGCAGCSRQSNIWRDILTALIIAVVVGGLFFGRER